MCKVFIAIVLMAVSVYCAPQGASPAQPTSKESKSALIGAGISESAAAGIVSITEKHMAAFQTMQSDVDAYMKTQSEADQAAYKAFVAKIVVGLLTAASKCH